MTEKVNIGINGYGTIGKRITDAINAQDDMEVVGVTKTRPSYEARVAIKENIPLYAAGNDHIKAFEEANIEVNGTLDDLLENVDLIVDCTPKGVGAKYAPVYKEKRVPDSAGALLLICLDFISNNPIFTKDY